MTYDILVNITTENAQYRYYNLTTRLVFHILGLFVDAYGRENVKATIRFF